MKSLTKYNKRFSKIQSVYLAITIKKRYFLYSFSFFYYLFSLYSYYFFCIKKIDISAFFMFLIINIRIIYILLLFLLFFLSKNNFFLINFLTYFHISPFFSKYGPLIKNYNSKKNSQNLDFKAFIRFSIHLKLFFDLF